jgi:hypothetical protein
VIWRASDNNSLRIYTTTIPAANRFYTLMHNRQYRVAIAWQNVGYNQPPHPDFFLGNGMSQPPPAEYHYVDRSADAQRSGGHNARGDWTERCGRGVSGNCLRSDRDAAASYVQHSIG